MNIDFTVVLEDRKLMKFYDRSNTEQELPPNIWSYTLEIKGNRMINGGLEGSLDILSYLRSQSIQSEIYTLTSGDLGFQENIDIPDGVYSIWYTMNNVIQKKNTILVYQNVKARVNELLKDADYSVDVSSNKMTYLNENSNDKYEIESVRYAKVLMDRLEMFAELNDEIEVNDTLDKLERLLGILKQ